MSTVEDHLDRWLDARLIDDVAAERIRAYERETPARPAARDAPGFMEVLVYLGIAVAAVGVVILVSTSWGDLEEWARIAVLAVPGLLALGLGQGLRSQGQPGLARGGHVAWLAAGALLAGGAAVAGDNAGWEARDNALAAGLAAVALALALWALAPSHPQVAGIAAAFFLLSIALADRPDEFSPMVGGLFLAGAGCAALVMTELGFLQPQLSARLLTGAGIAWGAFFAGFDQGWEEAFALLAGAGLVLAGVSRKTLYYVVFGVAAIFGGLVASITRHVDDASTAALFLIVIGAALVGTVLLLAQFRPWAREMAT